MSVSAPSYADRHQRQAMSPRMGIRVKPEKRDQNPTTTTTPTRTTTRRTASAQSSLSSITTPSSAAAATRSLASRNATPPPKSRSGLQFLDWYRDEKKKQDRQTAYKQLGINNNTTAATGAAATNRYHQEPRCWMCERICTSYGWSQLPTMWMKPMNFQPISNYTLCVSCATALSMPPGVGLEIVVSKCNQTHCALQRTRSFVAFLREYKMNLELISLEAEKSEFVSSSSPSLASGKNPSSASSPTYKQQLLADSSASITCEVLQRLLETIHDTLNDKQQLRSEEKSILLEEAARLQIQLEILSRERELNKASKARHRNRNVTTATTEGTANRQISQLQHNMGGGGGVPTAANSAFPTTSSRFFHLNQRSVPSHTSPHTSSAATQPAGMHFTNAVPTASSANAGSFNTPPSSYRDNTGGVLDVHLPSRRNKLMEFVSHPLSVPEPLRVNPFLDDASPPLVVPQSLERETTIAATPLLYDATESAENTASSKPQHSTAAAVATTTSLQHRDAMPEIKDWPASARVRSMANELDNSNPTGNTHVAHRLQQHQHAGAPHQPIQHTPSQQGNSNSNSNSNSNNTLMAFDPSRHLRLAADEFTKFEQEHQVQQEQWLLERGSMEATIKRLEQQVGHLKEDLQIKTKECQGLEMLNTGLNERLLRQDAGGEADPVAAFFDSAERLLNDASASALELCLIKSNEFSVQALHVSRYAADATFHARKLSQELKVSQDHLMHQHRVLEASRRAIMQAWNDHTFGSSTGANSGIRHSNFDLLSSPIPAPRVSGLDFSPTETQNKSEPSLFYATATDSSAARAKATTTMGNMTASQSSKVTTMTKRTFSPSASKQAASAGRTTTKQNASRSEIDMPESWGGSTTIF